MTPNEREWAELQKRLKAAIKQVSDKGATNTFNVARESAWQWALYEIQCVRRKNAAWRRRGGSGRR